MVNKEQRIIGVGFKCNLYSELTSQVFLVSHVNVLPGPSNGLKLLNFCPEAFNN